MEEKKINPRKAWKRDARQVIKKHYILLALMCAVLLYYGTEFGYIMANAQNVYQTITQQEIEPGQTLLKGVRTVFDDTDEETPQSQVLQSLFDNDADAGREKADEQMQQYADEQTTNAVKGRKHGIFAGIANTISSGRLFVILYDGISSIFKDGRTASVSVIVIDVLFGVAIWVFIKNMLSAVGQKDIPGGQGVRTGAGRTCFALQAGQKMGQGFPYDACDLRLRDPLVVHHSRWHHQALLLQDGALYRGGKP